MLFNFVRNYFYEKFVDCYQMQSIIFCRFEFDTKGLNSQGGNIHPSPQFRS